MSFLAEAARYAGKLIPAIDASVRAGSLPEEQFNSLARDLFEIQREHNPVLASLCRSRAIQRISNWAEIPFIPTAAFKDLEVTGIPVADRASVFHSSGTTHERPSRHFHHPVTLRAYEASLLPWFKRHVPVEDPDGRLVFLSPRAAEAPHSSLVHMFEAIAADACAGRTVFCGRLEKGLWRLDVPSLEFELRSGRPLLLLGTAFLFVHLLDHLAATHRELRLPPGSAILETGGYKGQSREIPREELHLDLSVRLGVPRDRIVTEYGMCELSSQAYDRVVGQTHLAGLFEFPPWARFRILSPESGLPAPDGEAGLVQVLDLANIASTLAIQTADLGVRVDGRLELLGRQPGSDLRGCSRMT